ncbi:MAG: amidohydrolase family protein [Candidatus Hydrogenedentes bacterium]|nr:amidohydrolase family protein [Candidatus Hydrogenedentota bacterium]
MSNEIEKLIQQTPFVDTHEHLWDERTRLDAANDSGERSVPSDIATLFFHYADADLVSAGLTPEDRAKALNSQTDVDEKWRILGPAYARTRYTGYLQNVRESVRLLFGEDDVTDSNYREISDRIRKQIQPRYYYRILREVANIEYCQVNSFEHPVFHLTEYPDLLCQDLSFVGLSTALNVRVVSEHAKREVRSLQDWHEVLDWVFTTYGPKAIAMKNQSAYGRRLDYDQVKAEDAAPLFAKYLSDPKGVTEAELKAIQDHLFHYCIEKSVEYRLPVKLHTGYYAGWNSMHLHRVRQNASDLCPILMAHPNARFILMHIDYPYQDEAIALAKQFPNAYIDMCWAWIINPAAGVRFVREFLMAASHKKLLTFGGDYGPVEMVPGHAAIARKGLTQAIRSLVKEDWLKSRDVPDVVDSIMRGNAHEIFDYKGTLKMWEMDRTQAPKS